MSLLAHLGAVVSPVFLIALAGYAWVRLGRSFDQEFVTHLVTRIGAPCLVFDTLVKINLPAAELVRMGGATIACLVLFAVIGAIGLRLVGLKLRVYLPSLVFPNIGNMGLPVCLFAFGQRGLALAMIYFTVCSVGQFAFGPAMAAGRFRLDLLLRMPLLYAAVAGVALGAAGFVQPHWLANTLDLLGQVTIPLMLLALGAALAQLRLAGWPRQLAVSAARLGLGAAGGWLVATALGLTGEAKGVVVVESAMPVAVFNYLFARLYGEAPEEVAGLVLGSTVLSAAVLPGVIALLL